MPTQQHGKYRIIGKTERNRLHTPLTLLLVLAVEVSRLGSVVISIITGRETDKTFSQWPQASPHA